MNYYIVTTKNTTQVQLSPHVGTVIWKHIYTELGVARDN